MHYKDVAPPILLFMDMDYFQIFVTLSNAVNRHDIHVTSWVYSCTHTDVYTHTYICAFIWLFPESEFL